MAAEAPRDRSAVDGALVSLLDEHQQSEQTPPQSRPVASLRPLLHRVLEAGTDSILRVRSYSATGRPRATALWRAGRHGNETQVPGNRARLFTTSGLQHRRPRLQVPSTPQKLLRFLDRD